jgi:hypothetical protein
VREIVVTAATIDITLSADAGFAVLRSPVGRLGSRDIDCRPAPSIEDEETITLSVPATSKRVGMEMRHLVEAPEDRRTREARSQPAAAPRPRAPLPRSDHRRRRSQHRRTRGSPRLRRTLLHPHRPLGFLAPDITAVILDGRQPIELSAKRLAITADLPIDRVEQRRVLGFACRVHRNAIPVRPAGILVASI